ncbi:MULTISPECIES: ComF family protein [unclassified Bacillus (in: firmicutes)]|uniref:ComF family protein n=1 Tax=unclassified Bacillus (in: firmicutes) TaxID=185979 RepID=UPI0008EF0E5B|nr:MULTISPECIES: ComF family protein [unclassified Bacillus (in: firmicutes)]SFB25340.1 competence protein ComFC [Bacillus sp. UNCCL13]SFQ91712.1 competence protein ComFC [Bacillus sp. cl95]
MNWLGHEYCLVCHELMLEEIGWGTIFSKEKEKFLCNECKSKLELIAGDTCEICDRTFATLDPAFRHENQCYDCIRWENDLEWAGALDQNVSLYSYNYFMKEIIACYKYRSDYVLAEIFVDNVKRKCPKADLYVPIPLSDERLYERGFNQAEAILQVANIPSTNLLTRIHSEKQSKKSRSDRIHLPQVFNLTKNYDLTDKKIVLIDDIYTTGSTLRHAAKLLKQNGAESVSSLTLARG